jgi:transposase
MNIMHTMASETRTTQVPKRRFYSPELKLQVVQTCAQPGASIAGVALQHGISTNIVHRWIVSVWPRHLDRCADSG